MKIKAFQKLWNSKLWRRGGGVTTIFTGFEIFHSFTKFYFLEVSVDVGGGGGLSPGSLSNPAISWTEIWLILRNCSESEFGKSFGVFSYIFYGFVCHLQKAPATIVGLMIRICSVWKKTMARLDLRSLCLYEPSLNNLNCAVTNVEATSTLPLHHPFLFPHRLSYIRFSYNGIYWVVFLYGYLSTFSWWVCLPYRFSFVSSPLLFQINAFNYYTTLFSTNLNIEYFYKITNVM